MGAETRDSREPEGCSEGRGLPLEDVVKVNCYIRDWGTWDQMNAIY